MQRRLPQPCPECGSEATIERAGVIVCTVCPAGRRQEAVANAALTKQLRAQGYAKKRRGFWASRTTTTRSRRRRVT